MNKLKQWLVKHTFFGNAKTEQVQTQDGLVGNNVPDDVNQTETNSSLLDLLMGEDNATLTTQQATNLQETADGLGNIRGGWQRGEMITMCAGTSAELKAHLTDIGLVPDTITIEALQEFRSRRIKMRAQAFEALHKPNISVDVGDGESKSEHIIISHPAISVQDTNPSDTVTAMLDEFIASKTNDETPPLPTITLRKFCTNVWEALKDLVHFKFIIEIDSGCVANIYSTSSLPFTFLVVDRDTDGIYWSDERVDEDGYCFTGSYHAPIYDKHAVDMFLTAHAKDSDTTEE